MHGDIAKHVFAYCLICVLPADINECEENMAGCEHSCTNTDGDYYCTCGSGHALTTDLHNCLGKLVVCHIH